MNALREFPSFVIAGVVEERFPAEVESIAKECQRRVSCVTCGVSIFDHADSHYCSRFVPYHQKHEETLGK